ncbi:short-chain dehydrogenase/reductase SDR [Aurantimonas manganoxydans SI85-9A1]|uniref:Short-chain dehydrogenase/reductase SDR n=2 Tax=Aurantimonas manganoxydans TaxID=651183 RepID=Q1YIG0_AURMS|nr:SDR family NAD(P)-dependent oxidoreductase [Aurantimonas manganoxydans]EAS50157.1 short-chain dehydrogenase/reductase SDR [Aurantimonas manganoxydans SI85-9A1]BAT29384.1 short-chain dehydrogenase/reductase SDR [Aurantimonas manganoxydans SI85-9A1]
MTKQLQDRVALVTGASRGIGYQIAKGLAAEGAHVIAVARTVGGLEELDDEIKALGGSATLVPLDLTDMGGIDRLGGAIHERWGKLDVLVANAGLLGVLAPIGHIEAKVFDKTMTVNVNATWRLIRTTDPLLRKSDAGRAIIMSSGAAHSAKAYWSLYAATKAACEALVKSWANETENLPLRVNSVNPGATRTAMRALAMPGEDAKSLPTPREVAAKIVPLAFADVTATGKLFDVRQDRFLDYRDPA